MTKVADNRRIDIDITYILLIAYIFSGCISFIYLLFRLLYGI